MSIGSELLRFSDRKIALHLAGNQPLAFTQHVKNVNFNRTRVTPCL